MYTYLFNRMIFIGLVSLILQVEVHAASSELPWEVWFRSQILKHPTIVAAREEMNSAFSSADGRERPLYNPQINSELEREGIDNNFRVGINQTIDLRNKLGTQREQATYSRIAAQQAFELIVQEKSAEALTVLVDWQGATEQAALALAQEEQLTTLLRLVQERLEAGDLSQIDAELSILNLSQRLNVTAQALARLAEAEASIRELLPEWSPERADVPEEFWQINNTSQFAQLIDTHPAVSAARAQWEVLQKSAELAQLQTKADPTVGIIAGRAERENVVGVTFSIPLYVRNNFSAQARAANQIALSAEARYLAIRRQRQYAMESAQSALREYQIRFERWQTLVQDRGDRSATLLVDQWQSGDISTTEYLLALQQLSDGLSAGIELQTRFQLARIRLLLETGRVGPSMTQPTQ